jgi:hypothetical protein
MRRSVTRGAGQATGRSVSRGMTDVQHAQRQLLGEGMWREACPDRPCAAPI